MTFSLVDTDRFRLPYDTVLLRGRWGNDAVRSCHLKLFLVEFATDADLTTMKPPKVVSDLTLAWQTVLGDRLTAR